MTPPTASSHAAPSQTLSGEAIHALASFYRVALRRKHYLIVCLVSAGALGAFYYTTATRIYEASAQILVERSGNDLMPGSSRSELDNQTLVANHQALISQPKVLTMAADRLQGSAPELLIDFEGKPLEDWPAHIRKNLSAQAINRTSVIRLAYTSKSSAAAQHVLGVVKDAYLDFVEAHHKTTSNDLLQTLQAVRGDVEEKLQQAQEKLLAVRRRVKVIGIEKDSRVVHPAVQRALQLNETLMDVQKQRVELQAALASLERALREGGDVRQYLMLLEPTVGHAFISTTLGLNNEQIHAAIEMERKLADDRARLETMRAHLGPTHPDMVNLQRSIENAASHLTSVQTNARNRLERLSEDQLGPMLDNMLREKLAKTEAHEQELTRQYALSEQEAVKLNDGLAELTIVERDMERQAKLHETLLTQMANLDIGQTRSGILVSVTGEPMALRQPISPRLSMVAILSLAAGLSIGLGMIYVVDMLDDRFRNPDELQQQLRLPLLAVVRRLAADNREGSDAILVHHSPSAIEAEAFRTLRTSVLLNGGENRRLAITSTEPGDGKTTVISNLAASLAQAGRRVLLIDADMRKPGLTKLFALRGLDGLSSILDAESPVDSIAAHCLLASGVPNLDIIPCGPKPLDPSELLARHRTSELLAWADRRYDHILIDCPPVMVASDAMLVSRATEGVILVVQPQKNPRRMVLQASEILRKFEAPMLGVVANRIAPDGDSGYSGYGYGYGYGYGDEEDAVAPSAAVPAELPAELAAELPAELPAAPGGGEDRVPLHAAASPSSPHTIPHHAHTPPPHAAPHQTIPRQVSPRRVVPRRAA